MGRLIATTLCSLDLRVADDAGRFDWAMPTAEVHAFVNDLERPVGTYLYGRRMWETMRVWQDMGDDDPVTEDYARLWRAADKVVYSRTLDALEAPSARLERTFEPDRVRALVDAAGTDVSIGGAELAGLALAAGLVDELRLLLAPVVVGEGPRALPDGATAGLELLEQRGFEGGWVCLRYRVLRPAA